mmetsp:Transcript_4990/g.12529  ORF Transcript_4990/g.12529 Transcript_4990/m.12529 type:complete len:245 (+) Transcript_4990:1988-2722(+)
MARNSALLFTSVTGGVSAGRSFFVSLLCHGHFMPPPDSAFADPPFFCSSAALLSPPSIVTYSTTELSSTVCVRAISRNSAKSIFPFPSLSYLERISVISPSLFGSPSPSNSFCSCFAVISSASPATALKAASNSSSFPSSITLSLASMRNSSKSMVPLLSRSYLAMTASSTSSGSQCCVRQNVSVHSSRFLSASRSSAPLLAVSALANRSRSCSRRASASAIDTSLSSTSARGLFMAMKRRPFL